MRALLAVMLVSLAMAGAPAAGAGAADLVASVASDDIAESSGVVLSRLNDGILWTHNDSGDGAYFYAVSLSGAVRGVWLARSAAAVDWEDMAAGPGWDGKGRYLFLGDIGDNELNRRDCCIYRVPEPCLAAGAPSSRKTPLLTEEPTVRILIAYPDGPHNAETLLVHPVSGRIYIVTKEESGEAVVFRLHQERSGFTGPHKIERVAVVKLPEVVCGGSISPDGVTVALRGYKSLYTLALPSGAADFDDVWKQAAKEWTLPEMAQSEAVDFSADSKTVYITSERAPMPIWRLRLSQ